MIDFLVDDDARAGVVEAALWYDLQQPGLGPQFIAAAEGAFVFVRDHGPLVTQPLTKARGRIIRCGSSLAFGRVLAVVRHGRSDRTWERRLS